MKKRSKKRSKRPKQKPWSLSAWMRSRSSGNSPYARSVQKLMRQGMSRKRAERLALSEGLKKIDEALK